MLFNDTFTRQWRRKKQYRLEHFYQNNLRDQGLNSHNTVNVYTAYPFGDKKKISETEKNHKVQQELQYFISHIILYQVILIW
jgi:hypothetical protein